MASPTMSQLIKTLVYAGSGSLGPQTMQGYHGHYYLRSKPRGINAGSGAQQVMQSGMTAVPKQWSALTESQRLSWRMAASSPGYGYALFSGAALRAAAVGAPIPTVPVRGNPLPTMPMTFGLTANIPSELQCGVTYHTPPLPAGQGDMLSIEIGLPQPGSRYSYHGPWQQVLNTDAIVCNGLILDVSGYPRYANVLGKWQAGRATRYLVGGKASKKVPCDRFWGAPPAGSYSFNWDPWDVPMSPSSWFPDLTFDTTVSGAVDPGAGWPGLTVAWNADCGCVAATAISAATGEYDTTVAISGIYGPYGLMTALTIDPSLSDNPYGFPAYPQAVSGVTGSVLTYHSSVGGITHAYSLRITPNPYTLSWDNDTQQWYIDLTGTPPGVYADWMWYHTQLTDWYAPMTVTVTS